MLVSNQQVNTFMVYTRDGIATLIRRYFYVAISDNFIADEVQLDNGEKWVANAETNELIICLPWLKVKKIKTI